MAVCTCRAGYYCPNASSQIMCPKGYFCKNQEVAPRKCTVLAKCPAGTSVPKFSALAFVIAVVVSAGPGWLGSWTGICWMVQANSNTSMYI